MITVIDTSRVHHLEEMVTHTSRQMKDVANFWSVGGSLENQQGELLPCSFRE
jgi:cob(I)alamin adenosyltransferase